MHADNVSKYLSQNIFIFASGPSKTIHTLSCGAFGKFGEYLES